MRAYKTVNDAYIEPISFTVPRRAEVFQSDIYPPAVGIKPAMSAAEWLSGKDGLPAKIDLESVYEGNAPVELPSDYKPPASTPAAAPAPSPAPAAAANKAPEPTPAFRAPAPTMTEQKGSIAALADKFQDNEIDDDDDDASSFEEISRPVQRAIPAAARTDTKPASPPKATVTQREAPKPSPISPTPRSVPPTIASPTPAQPSSAGSSSSGTVETSLQQIKSLLEAQTKTISALAHEVDTLKMRVGAGTVDQSERIRQLELELEAARS
jgi:coronin-1B/1C/6